MNKPPVLALTLGCISLLGFVGPGVATPALPIIPPGVFNITNYGAVGDGVTTNTAAIQSAIKALNAAGGGTLEVPPGRFLSGPLVTGSNTRFQLDAGATLLLLPRGSYPAQHRPPNFISVADGAHDVEFCGPGTLDGQGAPWWAAHQDEKHRPYEIHLDNCHRVFFHDWHSINPPMKHIVIDGISDNITVQNCTNTAPYPTPNTDCINLQGSNCLVRDCVFSGGDDNVAIGRSSGPCYDTLVTNITCGTGHGISIGSITTQGMSNITVENCTFSGTDFGIRLKAGRDRGGLVHNITYHDISMTNVHIAIAIYSYYNEKGPAHVSPQVAAGYTAMPLVHKTPVWRDISISNVTATGSALAGIIWGRPEMVVSNVTLDHINITANHGFEIYNARRIHLTDSRITTPAGIKTIELYNAQVELANREPSTDMVTMDGVRSANSLALEQTQASLSDPAVLGANPITLRASTLAVDGNLALPRGTVMNFALGARSSMVKAAGDANFGGVLNINDDGGFQAGSYTLFTYNGKWTGKPKLGTTPPGFNCKFDTNTSGQARLIVTAGH